MTRQDGGPLPPPPRHPTFEYAMPTGGGPPAFDNTALFGHLVGWALGSIVLLSAALFVIPRLEETFKDFKLDLPALTKFVLATSRWIRQWGWVLLPLPFFHAVLVAMWYPRARIGARRLYRLVLTLFVCALFALVILSMFLPYLSLIQSMANPPKR